MAAPSGSALVRPPVLWDPVIRLTHWIIALVVLSNAVLTRGGSSIHVWAGWIGLGLLVLRLVWGLIGPAEARFSAFPPRPLAGLRHLRQLAFGKVPHYPSHNPAGALMAYALWGLMATMMLTGLVMTGGRTPMQVADEQAAVAAGDWSVLVKTAESGENAEDGEAGDGGWKEAAEEVHEVASNLILFLVLLHVAGVFAESRAMGRNLVRPMLTGRSEGRS
jgi:cytochrome b